MHGHSTSFGVSGHRVFRQSTVVYAKAQGDCATYSSGCTCASGCCWTGCWSCSELPRSSRLGRGVQSLLEQDLGSGLAGSRLCQPQVCRLSAGVRLFGSWVCGLIV